MSYYFWYTDKTITNIFFSYIFIENMEINPTVWKYRDEKTPGFQRMILFVEIFANVKRFRFETFIRAGKILNDTKKMRKF